MNIRKVLTKPFVKIGLKGSSKEEILKEIAALLCSQDSSLDESLILASLEEREEKMSTGLEGGLAIPHGKTDAVSSMLACLAISEKEVDFDSLDNKPAQLFISTISPASSTGPHLQFLAEVGKLLKSKEKREALMKAKDDEEALEILFS